MVENIQNNENTINPQNKEQANKQQGKVFEKNTQKQDSDQAKAKKEAITEQKDKGTVEKIRELTDTLQRIQAEFENYQKRTAKQNEEFKLYANAKLMEEILPVLDSMELGMQHNKDLVIIHEQLYNTLKKNGLEKIVVKKGEAFNHDTMECMMQEQDPALCNGVVANILIEGYKLNSKILRPTKVSINNLEQNNSIENKEKIEKNKSCENAVKTK